MEKVCKMCGNVFNPENSRTKYCSDECRARALKLSLQKYQAKVSKASYTQHVCPVCGREFEGPSNRKYCSIGCLRKATAERNKEYQARYRAEGYKYKKVEGPIDNAPSTTCLICGEPLPEGRYRYCSDDCWYIAVCGRQQDRYVSASKTANPKGVSMNIPTTWYHGPKSTIGYPSLGVFLQCEGGYPATAYIIHYYDSGAVVLEEPRGAWIGWASEDRIPDHFEKRELLPVLRHQVEVAETKRLTRKYLRDLGLPSEWI